MTDRWTRREFLESAAAGAAALAAGRAFAAEAGPAAAVSVSVFSKHLQYLDYRALAETAAEAGFDGIDLTVREGGHVLPERVRDDLPKAVEAARAAGIAVPMITTTIVSARDTHAAAVRETAGRLGVRDLVYNRMAPSGGAVAEPYLNWFGEGDAFVTALTRGSL